MSVYSLGTLIQVFHGLKYPITNQNEFLDAIKNLGDVVIKGISIENIAKQLHYPLYSGGDCIEKVLSVVEKLTPQYKATAPTTTTHTTYAPKKTYEYSREYKSPYAPPQPLPRPVEKLKPEVSTPEKHTEDIISLIRDMHKLRTSEDKISTLVNILNTTEFDMLKSKADNKELSELELKTALARLRKEYEESAKAVLELEIRKKELEIEAKEREREFKNHLELELKKKELETESRERERELRNRLELEMKKKELELETKAKIAELDMQKRALDDEVNKRVSIAVKEQALELRTQLEREYSEKIERIRKEYDDEIAKREDLVRKKVMLELREKGIIR